MATAGAVSLIWVGLGASASPRGVSTSAVAALASKEANFAAFQARNRAAAAKRAPLAAPPLVTQRLGQLATGIAQDQPQEYQTLQMAPNTVWSGQVAGQSITVHAGSVGTWALDGGAPTANAVGELALENAAGVAKFTNPAVRGPFTIVAESGEALTVAGSNGAQFTFNVITGAIAPVGNFSYLTGHGVAPG